MGKRKEEPRHFGIKTVYYHNGKIVKVTRSMHASSASKNCFDHLQNNDYEATVGEVWDEDTGDVHCVHRRKVSGVGDPVEIKTLFKRNPEDYANE